MKLYNAWYCPFAQRAWMAMAHKKIDFEYIEVDPYDYSDWWLQVSRGAALVPVVVQPNDDGGGDTTIVESNRILEYLEDLEPQSTPIFASDPNQRAEQKYWMDHIGNKVTPYLYRFLKASDAGDARDLAKQELIDGLSAVVEAMDTDGPYFSGAQLDAVDIALAPFALRIDLLLGHYRDFVIPDEGKTWQRYHRWYAAIQEVPAFKATAYDQPGYRQRLVEHYLPYSQGEGQKDVTEIN